MANTFPSTLVPRIIGFAKEVMAEEFALAALMDGNYSDASGKVGDVVSIGVVERGSAQDITPANVAPDGSDIDTTDRTLEISQFKGSKPVRLTSTEKQKYELTSLMQQQIRESIRQVSYVFNAYAWERMNLRTPRIAGTAARSIFNDGSNPSIDPLADVYKVLRDANNDMNMLDMIITPTDEANAKKVDALQKANEFGSRQVVVDASIGKVQGFNIFVDQQIPKHTIGTITTGLTAKASTAVAVGATSVVATTAASTGACALKAGDPLTIDGNQYVLQADATQASAASDVTLSIFPAMKTALTGGEAITITTGAGTAYTELAGNLKGIAAVTRLPETSILGIATQGTHVPVTDPKSGVTMLLSFYGQHFQAMFQAGLVYGCDVVDDDKLVKVFTHA